MIRTWECRYFLAELPGPFTHRALSRRFSRQEDAVHMRDVYVLGASGANLKLRLSVGTLKLKLLLERRPDGFEQWRTAFDLPWPPPAAAWRRAAKALDVQSLDDLAAARPQDLVSLVRKNHPTLRVGEVAKTRRFYRAGPAQVEVARVMSGSRTFHSVEFEASTLKQALAIRAGLPAELLGEPTNYLEAGPKLLGW